MTELHLPEICLVVLVGATGSGKSTFAARHFRPTEVVSSDRMRGLVSDDETDQSATAAAFEILHAIVRKRLQRGLLTVVDATNVHADARRSLVALAREFHVFAVAVVLDVPDRVCIDRNQLRPERMHVPAHVARTHTVQLRRSLRNLKQEGFRFVRRLGLEELDEVQVVRDPLWTNRKHVRGPFDLVGDIHGCYEELCLLMDELGWERTTEGRRTATHPEGRQLVFVGDLVDRGPDSPGVLELVMNLVEDGVAMCVTGNHDAKLLRVVRGATVKRTHGLAETMEQLAACEPAFLDRVQIFLDGLISHYVLDEGRLVVAHAGIPEEMHNRTSGRVREFAMYGDTTGEIDEYGLPIRLDWARHYRGRAMVVHGHVPVVEAEWHNNTLDIDTGCCFGGKLTALRYPERELLSVPAAREYYAPIRPLGLPPSAVTRASDAIDVEDIAGRHHVDTRLAGRVGIAEANAAASLETLSRFTLDPRWLIHLPPTMAPPATSQRPGLLEHPDEAFAYYEQQGVGEVVCEEKHMGSRALFLVCRDADAAAERFGVEDGSDGVAWTRTGRHLVAPESERALIGRLREALDRAGTWERLETGWVLIDAELLPWSAKASALVSEQYAPVGAAAIAATRAVTAALQAAAARGLPVEALLAEATERCASAEAYDRVWRQYVGEVAGPDDLQIAPFHLLASEGGVHVDRDHRWHLAELGKLAGPGILATEGRFVSLSDPAARAAAADWWASRCSAGGEGMVVKPTGFVVRGPRGVVQPAIKVRGPEYLRMIYGPEYLRPANLERLRRRGLSTKRQLALREFALGIESLERFVRREPRWRVHQAVAGVLALEAEVVDPRL